MLFDAIADAFPNEVDERGRNDQESLDKNLENRANKLGLVVIKNNKKQAELALFNGRRLFADPVREEEF